MDGWDFIRIQNLIIKLNAMIKLILPLFLFVLITGLNAQPDTFENLALEPETFWNGSDGTADNFLTESFYFPALWDTSFGGYWAGGWAYSNKTDSVTSGFANQYSAKAGSGYQGSQNYAVANSDGWFKPRADVWQYVQVNGLRITNSTYAYNSMRDGDAFGKKFGGETGNDPDYFLVNFMGYSNGEPTSTEPVKFYLADFRFEDNSQDYIVSDWVELDLSDLQFVDSIAYTFESSDIFEFGINTPMYFCIDQINYSLFINSVASNDAEISSVYPNPASYDVNIQINSKDFATYELLSIEGKFIKNGGFQNQMVLNVNDLSSGVYLLRVNTSNAIETHRLIVK
jgi:hypothetical protein